jgi:hypothetical protein
MEQKKKAHAIQESQQEDCILCFAMKELLLVNRYLSFDLVLSEQLCSNINFCVVAAW